MVLMTGATPDELDLIGLTETPSRGLREKLPVGGVRVQEISACGMNLEFHGPAVAGVEVTVSGSGLRRAVTVG